MMKSATIQIIKTRVHLYDLYLLLSRSRQRVNAGGGPSSLNLFQNNEPSTPSTDRIATAVPAPRSFGGGGQSFAQKQPM